MPMSRDTLIWKKSIIGDNGFAQIIYDQTHKNPDRSRGDKWLQSFMQRFRGKLTSWKHHYRIAL